MQSKQLENTQLKFKKLNGQIQIDEEICIAPYCEEIRLLVMPAFSMCGEHEKEFMKYIDNFLLFLSYMNYDSITKMSEL